MNQEPTSTLKCVSEKELCALLGITRITANRWRKSKINPLPAHKVNKRILYFVAEVEKWIATHEGKPSIFKP